MVRIRRIGALLEMEIMNSFAGLRRLLSAFIVVILGLTGAVAVAGPASAAPVAAATVTGQAQLPAGAAHSDTGIYLSIAVESGGQPYTSAFVERAEPVGNSALSIPFEVKVPSGAAYSIRAYLIQYPADPLKASRYWQKVVDGSNAPSGATIALGGLALSSLPTISGVVSGSNLPDESTFGDAVLYKSVGAGWVEETMADGVIWSSGDGEGNKRRYTFTNLPVGTYTVGFAARSSSTGVNPAATPQFWDHKSTLGQANPIAVTADSRFENVNGEVVFPSTVPPGSGGIGTGAVSIKGPGSELLPGVTVEIRKNTCEGAAVWRTTTTDRPDAYGAFGIGLEAGPYCVRTLSVPAPYLLPADVVFTMEKRAANWVTVWVPKANEVVTGAVVAKDAWSRPINGVRVYVSVGSCANVTKGVWENTTAANRWAQGGFGIGLGEGLHCITTLAVPDGYTVPAQFEVTVTSPSPYWVTVWVPGGRQQVEPTG